MINAHQKRNFLLQSRSTCDFCESLAVFQRPLRHTLSRRSISTQVNRSEMALAKLLEDPVLVAETMGISRTRVAEDKPGFVQNRYFIADLPTRGSGSGPQGIVDKGSVAGEILQHRHHIALSVLGENEKMPIGDGGNIKDPIW